MADAKPKINMSKPVSDRCDGSIPASSALRAARLSATAAVSTNARNPAADAGSEIHTATTISGTPVSQNNMSPAAVKARQTPPPTGTVIAKAIISVTSFCPPSRLERVSKYTRDPQVGTMNTRAMINTAEGPDDGSINHNRNYSGACRFHGMRWGCGIAHVILAAERDDDTRVINGMRRWLYGRAVHQDHLARDNPATLVCRSADCPLFPPRRVC